MCPLTAFWSVAATCMMVVPLDYSGAEKSLLPSHIITVIMS